jgi:hypothetical protein
LSLFNNFAADVKIDSSVVRLKLQKILEKFNDMGMALEPKFFEEEKKRIQDIIHS